MQRSCLTPCMTHYQAVVSLHLPLQITPDPGMLRVGDDLHSDLPLRVWDAVTGGAVRVQTVRGEAMLQVPPGVYVYK